MINDCVMTWRSAIMEMIARRGCKENGLASGRFQFAPGRSWFLANKIGAEIGDPNLRSQPRLPGSVVGEGSMGQSGAGNKITEGTVLR